MRKILIQLDADKHPSSFDRFVAIDAGAEEVFSYGGVEPGDVEGLVHGALFTRKPSDLSKSAIFIGGKNVGHAEELLARTLRTFFGPFRTSVLFDASGSNTTAAAAVLAIGGTIELAASSTLVLGGTGPVGQRVALLLARQGGTVWLGSRSLDRARDLCEAIKEKHAGAQVFPAATATENAVEEHPGRFDAIVAAGAAGARLLARSSLASQPKLRVLVDLNAVPPSGIEGVEPTDNRRLVDGLVQFGALGVGGTKMKIHKAAVARLFEANDLVLDAEQIYDLGQRLLTGNGRS